MRALRIFDHGDGTVRVSRNNSFNTAKPMAANELARFDIDVDELPTAPEGVDKRFWAWDGSEIVEASRAVQDAIAATDADAQAEQAAAAEVALTPFERAARLAISKMVLATDLTENQIADLVDVFAPWTTGTAYATNTITRYDGKVYECIQPHTSQTDWTPDVVPALWAIRSPSPNVIEAWVQPYGGSGTYIEGAIVTHNGETWLNTVAAPTLNVWEPGVYGWTTQ